MAEPLSPSHISPSLSDNEGSSQGVHPKLPQSLEDQGVELGIVLSIQPLSYRPRPTSDTRSPVDIGPESPNNPVQTPKSSPTTDSQHGLVICPLNPLFEPVVTSVQSVRSVGCSFGIIPSYFFSRSSSFVPRYGT